ncbi:MAG: hypothetical protein M3Y79_11990 [Pseudomonadota bacterium]|nr:hypothetical protein [Pseudomonadota bacterium]
MSLVATLGAALLPAVSDGVRAIFNRVTNGAGARPVNVAELVQLMQAENDRLRILQQLDAPGDVHRWVNDLRALQRPAMATLVLASYASAALWFSPPKDVVQSLGELAGMVIFYLFGAAGWKGFHAGK